VDAPVHACMRHCLCSPVQQQRRAASASWPTPHPAVLQDTCRSHSLSHPRHTPSSSSSKMACRPTQRAQSGPHAVSCSCQTSQQHSRCRRSVRLRKAAQTSAVRRPRPTHPWWRPCLLARACRCVSLCAWLTGTARLVCVHVLRLRMLLSPLLRACVRVRVWCGWMAVGCGQAASSRSLPQEREQEADEFGGDWLIAAAATPTPPPPPAAGGAHHAHHHRHSTCTSSALQHAQARGCLAHASHALRRPFAANCCERRSTAGLTVPPLLSLHRTCLLLAHAGSAGLPAALPVPAVQAHAVCRDGGGQ
jgi:hypothetical protein